jgi:hypothetical protein
MIRNIIKWTIALSVAFVLSAAVAMAAKGTHIDIPKDSVLPDGQVLKAGSYTVQFSEKADSLEFLQHGKVVAKLECHCKVEEKKNLNNEVDYIIRDGKNVIKALRLAGDNREISFEASGM